jgi:hypothetical protein
VLSLLIALGFGIFVVLIMPVVPFEDSIIICNHGMIKMTFFGIVYVIATTLLVFVLPVVWVSFFHFRILCLVSSFYVVVSIIYKFLYFKFKMKSSRKKLSQKLSSNVIKKRMKRETVYGRKIFSKLLRKKKVYFITNYPI